MTKEQPKTKSFVLRIDATTMEALEKWAADEFRSINGQLSGPSTMPSAVPDVSPRKTPHPQSTTRHLQNTSDTTENGAGRPFRAGCPIRSHPTTAVPPQPEYGSCDNKGENSSVAFCPEGMPGEYILLRTK